MSVCGPIVCAEAPWDTMTSQRAGGCRGRGQPSTTRMPHALSTLAGNPADERTGRSMSGSLKALIAMAAIAGLAGCAYQDPLAVPNPYATHGSLPGGTSSPYFFYGGMSPYPQYYGYGAADPYSYYRYGYPTYRYGYPTSAITATRATPFTTARTSTAMAVAIATIATTTVTTTRAATTTTTAIMTTMATTARAITTGTATTTVARAPVTTGRRYRATGPASCPTAAGRSGRFHARIRTRAARAWCRGPRLRRRRAAARRAALRSRRAAPRPRRAAIRLREHRGSAPQHSRSRRPGPAAALAPSRQPLACAGPIFCDARPSLDTSSFSSLRPDRSSGTADGGPRVLIRRGTLGIDDARFHPQQRSAPASCSSCTSSPAFSNFVGYAVGSLVTLLTTYQVVERGELKNLFGILPRHTVVVHHLPEWLEWTLSILARLPGHGARAVHHPEQQVPAV